MKVKIILLLVAGFCCEAAALPEVRVRVFSKYRLTEASLLLHGSGWSDGSRYLSSGTYRMRTRQGQVVLEGPGYREEGSLIRLQQASPEARFSVGALRILRQYQGQLELRESEGGLVVICLVPLEAYTASVLFGEVPPLFGRKNTLEALKAQAVAIRSYSLYYLDPGRARHAEEYCNFCDLTHCQVYGGVVPTGYRIIMQAVAETKGVLLRHKGHLVPGFYSSTCGGRTVSPGEVWGDDSLDTAFRGAQHRHEGRAPCQGSEHFTWSFAVGRRAFRDFFTGACFPLLSETGLRLVKGPGGTVTRLEAGSQKVPGYHFRNLFCKKWGWNSLRSLDFSMELTGGEVIFKGRGLGHRIGLCQYGAFALAAAGWSWRQILGEYYPALSIRP